MAEEDDEGDDEQTVEASDAVRPTPAMNRMSASFVRCLCAAHLARATKKPNANGERNGDTMKPMVQRFNLKCNVNPDDF